jgi:hypothetical protein
METLKNILIRNWFGLTIAIILLLVCFNQCEQAQLSQSNLEAATSQNKVYKNAIGTLTTQNKTLQLTEKELKNLVLKKDDTLAKLVKKFSQVQTIVKTNTITQIDTIKIKFETPAPCAFVREGSEVQRWFSLQYRVDSTGLRIDSLKIPNTQIVASGLQRKWFLGKETLVTEVSNTNPNIKNVSVESYKTIVKKKWYDSFVFKFGIGVAAGILIAK